MSHFIKCTDGKERQIFPAKIKHKDRIRHFTTKFSAAAAIVNLMAVDNEKAAKLDDENFFDETPYNAMMEILRLAFGEKYSVEQIEEFLDVEMIGEILDVFYGMSGYKKKVTQNKEPIGMS